jgi:hypothetical protein
MNISKVIPGFHNGVSRQAATMRLDTQVEAAENSLGTLVEGTLKRPNTDFIATLTSLADGDVFMHTIVRDETERYFLILTGDASVPIEVFTEDGTPCTIRYGTLDDSMTFTEDATVKQYLNMASGRAKNNFRAVTIADHTFIVNRLVYADMSSTVSHSGGSLDGSVQSFDKLTDVSAAEGEVWEVTGNDTNHFDNYYVQKQAGTLWLETIAPNIPYQLESSLMPHRLVRTALNQFTLAPIEWGERTCGDDASAPVPSFVGNRITNIFFFRNRLGFLSGDNVVLSAAGDYYRLFPKTALDVLDDDPIDVSASLKEVSTLHSVAGFNKSLLILGSPQQFSLSSGDNSLLTPATVSLDGTTRFAVQPNCEPVAMGSTVYFANPREQHLAIREYLIQENTLMEDAADVTAHCPDYIPTGDITMCGITSMDTLFVHTSGDPASLYVYKFYWTGNEKAQSAWHRWTFDDNILSITTLDEALYIIFDGNETKLERINIETLDDGDLDFRCHLDHKVQMEGQWTGEVTRFLLPYTPKAGTVIPGGIDENTILMLQSDSPPYIGEPIDGDDDLNALLVHSNTSTPSDPIVDSSPAERALTVISGDAGHYFINTASKKKFGLSSITTSAYNLYDTRLTFPMESTEGDINFSEDFTIDCWMYVTSYPYSNGDPPEGWTGDSGEVVALIGWGNGYMTDGVQFRVGVGGSNVDNSLHFLLNRYLTDVPTSQFDAIDGRGDNRINLVMTDAFGAFPLNTWVHVAVERHNDRISVYRDGRKVIGFDFGGKIENLNEYTLDNPGFGIMSGGSTEAYWDEYRVSRFARYMGGGASVGAYVFIPESFAYGATPIVYDRTVKDSSDYEHTAAFENDAYHKNDDSWPVRFPRTSFYFDGVDGAIQCQHSSMFNFTIEDFTIDWSMNLKDTDGAVLFQKQASDDWGWRVAWDGDGVSFQWSNTKEDISVQSVTWTFELNVDTWYHLAMVRHGSVMSLYVNGRSKGDRVFTGDVQVNEQPLWIGTDSIGMNPLHGAMEEIRISNVARWTSNFLPPLAAYTRDADGWYDGINGGIPDGFDPDTMSESYGLQYPASAFGMDIVHPVSGLNYPEATIFGDELYVRENLAGYTMIIGKNYTMSITLTPIYMQDSNGKSILDGRLQLRSFTFGYKDTGYFNFAVAPIGRSVMVKTFSGVTVGSSILGRITIHTGEKRFMVMSNAKGTTLQVTNETYLPSKIQSASYEATFIKRNKSV